MTPLVAIRCITYNHEPYIRDALEGFVMQKTDFPFVAVVHDDASTDRTADIIREYAAKYPHIIKPIYETENQYSKGDGSMSRMMNRAVVATGAKYIALCEGDDYWTDPLKLQKQVDFLESHPDYSLVFAKTKVVYPTGKTGFFFDHLENRDYSPVEIYKTWTVPTATVLLNAKVYTSRCFAQLQNIKRPVMGDITLFLSCSTLGRLHCLGDVVSVYRKLPTGAATFISNNDYLFFLNRIAISNYFGNEFKNIDREKFYHSIVPAFKKLPNDFWNNLNFLIRYTWFAPLHMVRRICNIPCSIIRRCKHLITGICVL